MQSGSFEMTHFGVCACANESASGQLSFAMVHACAERYFEVQIKPASRTQAQKRTFDGGIRYFGCTHAQMGKLRQGIGATDCTHARSKLAARSFSLTQTTADTLLNVFLAIAVDNLANAQELTKVQGKVCTCLWQAEGDGGQGDGGTLG